MKDTTQHLLGKVALVTGAGRMRGTGRAIAVALAAHGCDVVLNGSGSDPAKWPDSEQQTGWKGLDSVADEISALGRRALPIVADLRDSNQVDVMIERAVNALGRLDILVNNAAAPRGDDRDDVVNLSNAAWHNVLDVKLNGSFYCSRAAARVMIAQKQGGRIINISSIAGKRGGAKRAAYNVANASIQMLGATLARELGPYAITVNSLCLGVIDTSRIDELGRGEEFRAYIAGLVPLNRPASASEIGEVVAFMAGDAAGYITGQSINVDGGALIH